MAMRPGPSSYSLWSWSWPSSLPCRGARTAPALAGAARPEHLALKLAPCAKAVEDPDATPSSSCCAEVRDIWRWQSPGCLCAMILSDTVKHAGIKVEAAITIPKRCNLASRPVGYKCGEYTLPSMQN